MSDGVKDLTLEFDQVSDSEMWALAQMVKRIYYEDMRKLAVDDEETSRMASGVGKLADALARAGYAPR